MSPYKIKKLFEILKSANPEPKTELNYSTSFELLIAVLLSAQATDISVNKATLPLFKKANTPKAILKLGEEKLKGYIKTIGLYNTKGSNIIKLCEILENEHNGVVPNNREALERLPGVGRKTANVVLNTAFGEPTIAVDTHIFRVSNRLNLGPGKNPLEVEMALLKAIPKMYLKDAHHWLILHGRYVCTARSPKCLECPLYELCEYKDKHPKVK